MGLWTGCVAESAEPSERAEPNERAAPATEEKAAAPTPSAGASVTATSTTWHYAGQENCYDMFAQPCDSWTPLDQCPFVYEGQPCTVSGTLTICNKVVGTWFQVYHCY